MHGEFFLAWSKRSRTRLAPTPTNISTNSEPEIEKNGTPASPATALLSSVLPVPGGPTSSTPFGIRAPRATNFSGYFRNSTISVSSCLASSTPATSANVMAGLSPAIMRARDRPKEIAWLLPLWVCLSTHHMKAAIRTTRMMFGSRTLSRYVPLLLLSSLMLVFVEYWVHQSLPLLEQSGTVTLCLVPPLSVATASVPFTSTVLTPPSLMFVMRVEYDDQCEIEQAGAGEAAQLGSPRGLSGDFSTAICGFLSDRIRVTVTCREFSPGADSRSRSTATPGTHANRSPAKTSGRASRSSRGTRASTRMSCSLRVPGPPAGRMRSPGRRCPRVTFNPGFR